VGIIRLVDERLILAAIDPLWSDAR
jgi:hypothetical protein